MINLMSEEMLVSAFHMVTYCLFAFTAIVTWMFVPRA